MKKLLFLCLLPFYTLAQSGTDSTLSARIYKLEQSTNYMAKKLDQSGKEFTIGILSTVAGAGFAISRGYTENKFRKGLYLGGAALMGMIGVTFIYSAHCTIAQAGRWKFSPGSVRMEF